MVISFTNDTSSAKEQQETHFAKGVNGSIKVNDFTIEIQRAGFSNKLLGLRGNKEINIKSITSIQFKEPGLLTNGFIQFTFAGSNERQGGTFDAVKDENSVVFNKKQVKTFRAIKETIDKKRHQTSSVVTPIIKNDSLGDLEKLAELRDRKIITCEEFDAKKKQILGL